MYKVVLSGGPHSGKTTLLEALKHEYPDAYFVPEAAGQVIRRELAKQEADASYEPIMPVTHYPQFQPLVVEESLQLEAEIPDDAELVFLDRGLPDNLGYSRLNAFEDHVAEIEQKIKLARYTLALFCEPVGTYQQTEIRRETPEQARATHDALSLAYDMSEVHVVHLPAVPVVERLAIVDGALRNTR